MICKEAQTFMDGYADRELDLVRSLEMEQHIEGCASCSKLYRNHQALHSAMRDGTLYFSASPALEKQVRAAVRKESKAERHETAWRWRHGWTWLSAPVAAAIVAAFVWIALSPRPSPNDLLVQEVLASHVRSLMASHLTDVPSSDQHTVKPWFDGRLDFSPPVVDLAAQGFPLVGGRLDYLDGRPVAALVYHRRQHLINLFLWPSAHPTDLKISSVTRHGYHILHWYQSGMTCWAVSDVGTGDLDEFARLFQH